VSDLRFGIAVFCVSAFMVLLACGIAYLTDDEPVPPAVALFMFGMCGMVAMALWGLGVGIYIALGRVLP
jgi:hypothetical protein